jgi:RimJ/RimL family protein N-acetyltransferase
MPVLPDEPIPVDDLLLRRPTLGDADDVVATSNDPDTHRFLAFLPSPYTRTNAEKWITKSVPESWATGSAGFVVADGATGRLLGALGLRQRGHDDFSASVGYWTAPWARRRGVATRSLRGLVRWAFGHGFGRIELFTDPANAASMRVALGAGFTHEGVRRAADQDRAGNRRDVVAWVRLATDSGEAAVRRLPDQPSGALTDGTVTVARAGPADANNVYELAILPEVRATTVVTIEPTHASVAEHCETAEYQWLIGARADCVIRDAATGAFAGDIGLFCEPATGQAIIGYSVAREWRGRRYAEHATRLLADWALTIGIARLVAGAAPDNLASQRTLERAGFTREGYERQRLPGPSGTRVDNVAYARLPGDPVPPLAFATG